MTPQRANKIAAILPSLLVAIVHFTLSVRLGPASSVIFQRWFDTGARPTGTDAVIASVNGFLSRPIPAVAFAGHPVYGLLREWWIATIANSLIWGLTLYASYLIASWVLHRISRRST